ncbi:MAG: alginate export family protein [Planctomycetota bacterium]|nr:alginate export family protein [Planctomycetota bacterium]MCB9824745.1 alginate export family protein [Planctomycetota bacterium]MCB9899844.1 alginate export family protein [Planctomycetota bacterium]
MSHRIALLLVVGICLLASPRQLAAGESSQASDPCACPCPDCPDNPCCTCREPEKAACPPKIANRRFLEDWKPCLCVPCCEKDGWAERIKAVRLTRRHQVWVDFGGQVRARYESFRNQGFGAPADPDDDWLLARVRAHADVHVGDHVRVFLEGIWADQFDERELGPRPIDIDRGDLLNAFGELKGDLGFGATSLWLGRRELETGKQRLVSPLDWGNTRRTFEGGGLTWKRGVHGLDVWYTNPVVVDADDFNEKNDDVVFWGVDYANRQLTCITWGAYAYGLSRDDVDEDRLTLGLRADGAIGGTRLDYDVEAAWQTGEIGTDDISAWMASATVSWRPCTACGDPKIGLGFDYASGDDDPADGTQGRFDQLFPLGHAFLGHADVIGRSNLLAARVEGSYDITKSLNLKAWFHAFWRADTADAAYNAAGGVLRAAGGSDARAIGTELDVMLTYKLDARWQAFVEWAHVFAGRFLEDTGASEDLDAIYLGLQGTF